MKSKAHRINFQSHINFILLDLQSRHQIITEASEPWQIYWITSSLRLLNYDNSSFYEKTLNFILERAEQLFNIERYFITHLGSIYASVAVLYQFKKTGSINKKRIIDFLKKMKRKDGSFQVCENGECDLRGIYCALAICKMLEINEIGLFDKSKEFLLNSQTYEGGFAPFPNGEAHGGYTYCSIASLKMLDAVEECNILSLSSWLISRQDAYNLGLNGRTNKNSDSCYGFWIGASIIIIEDIIKIVDENWVADVSSYILKCQSRYGGFRDKEQNSPDIHHTCYSLFFLAMFDTSDVFICKIDPVLGIVKKIH